MLSATEHADLHYALDALTQSCLQRFGFDWPHDEYAVYRRYFQDEHTVWLAWDYGVTEPTNGYERPSFRSPGAGGTTAPYLVLMGAERPSEPIMPALETASPGSHDGTPIPPGGCRGEAWRALDDAGGIGWDSIAVQMWTRAVELTSSEEGYAEALAPWRACVLEAGFAVTDPIDDEGDIRRVIDSRPATGPTGEELRLAAADAACKEHVGLIAALTPLRESAQSRVREEYQAELMADRAMMDGKVQLARSAIDELPG